MSKSLFAGVGLVGHWYVARGAWRVVRMAVVAVMALVFGLAGFVAEANADFTHTDNFAGGTYTYWQNTLTGDDQDWSLSTTGDTPSNNTGPDTANSPTPDGDDDFTHIEATDFANGDIAYLLSTNTYNATTEALSASFYWHMYDSTNGDMGTLTFDVSVDGGAWTTLFTRTGDQGNTWTLETVDLSSYTSGTLQFRFTATRGAGYASDASVDLVTISGTTRCTPSTVTANSTQSAAGTPVDLCSTFSLNSDGDNAATLNTYTVTEPDTTRDDNFDDNSLDAKWSTELTGSTGAVTETGQQLNITNTGLDLWDTTNEYSFAYQTITGDFTVTAYVASLVNTDVWAKAGVMIKNDLDSGTTYPALANTSVTPGSGISFQRRANDGDTTMTNTEVAGSSPEWVRLVKSGNSITSYTSNDGSTFTQIGTAQTINFSGSVLVGVFATSHNGGAETTAVFDDFTITGLTNQLYTGTSCSNIDASTWTDGTKDFEVIANDGCGGTVTDTGTFGYTSDNTGPIAGTVTVSPESGTYVPADFSISTSFSDAESAVTSCEYTIDGTNWSAGSVSGSGPWTCSANVTGATGSLTINMRATSGGGTTTATSISRTVDAVAPSTTATPAGGTFTTEPDITLSASDAGSGVQETLYCIDTTNSCSPATVYSGAVTITGTAGTSVTKYLRFASSDNLNNTEATQSETYIIDLTCTDGDLATLSAGTDPASPVSGTTTVYATVGTETAPDTMTNMAVTIAGSSSCNVTGAAMSWSAGNSRWEYSWDTNTCGTANVESGVTIDISGNEPDCSNPLISASQISVTIDNRPNDLTTQAAYGTQSGVTAIVVTMPYSGDGDGDATFQVDYKLSTDGTYTNGTPQDDTDNVSPYEQTLTGLTADSTYDFRVTYDDPDGVTGTATQTFSVTLVSWVDNDMLHNSLRFACDVLDADGKTITNATDCTNAGGIWNEDRRWTGGWGTSGADDQYGAILCSTCHEKLDGTNNNIKRVTDQVTLSGIPGASETVVYTSAEDGSSDLAEANGAHASSNKICEVCHTYSATDVTVTTPTNGVRYHGYNMSGASAADQSHYLQSDCINCHNHNVGFRASCAACHGNPPVDGSTLVTTTPTGSATAGAHNTHVNTLGYSCERCHAGSVGSGVTHDSDGTVTLSFADLPLGAAAGADGGSYSGQTGVTYDTTDGGTTQVPPAVTNDGNMSCANYCHGSTIGGAAEEWNDASVPTCNVCHGGTADNPPKNPASETSHATHAGTGGTTIYQGGDIALVCAECHRPGPFNDGTHVSGVTDFNVTSLDQDYQSASAPTYAGNTSGDSGGLAPSGTYQTCNNLLCHWGTETPAWNAGPADCTTCHGGATTGSTGAPDTGQHAEHVLASEDYITCDSCHGTNSSGGLHAGHIDGLLTLGGDIDATIHDEGTTTRQAGDANYADDDSCARACHQQADWGDNGAYNTASWNGGTATIDWSGGECDPGTFAIDDLCIDCHSDAFAYGGRSGPIVVTGWDFTGPSTPTGDHLLQNTSDSLEGDSTCNNLVQWKARCNGCHTKHSGSVLVPNPPASWTLGADTTSPLSGADMQVQLGIKYVGTEHGGVASGGIHLGGTWTSGSTEAEYCWGCHGTDESINEWGYNTDPDGTTWPDYNGDTAGQGTPIATKSAATFGASQASHNFGVVYTTATGTTQTSAWVNSSGTGYWHRDAYSAIGGNVDGGMNRQITAVHSVNFDSTKQVSSVKTAINWTGTGTDKNTVVPTNQEGAGDIRCSYCHDVHDLALASGDSATGKPWLRGTWRSNPYPPDMPPESGQTNTTNFALQGPSPGTERMPAPRATSAATHKGGYFIDRNANMTDSSHTYTAGFSNATDAGICILCHGGSTSGEVDSMDFYTNSTTNQNMWRGSNGHGFAALGGTRNANSVDLFDPSFGVTDDNDMFVVMGMQPWQEMNFAGSPHMKIESCPENRQFGEGTMRPPDIRYFGWVPATGVAPIFDTDNSTACSNQTVATASPADTWYQANHVPAKYHNFTCSKCHSPHASGLPALLITNCLDQNLSTWETEGLRLYKQAPNCHRKETGATGATDTGWHVLQGGQ